MSFGRSETALPDEKSPSGWVQVAKDPWSSFLFLETCGHYESWKLMMSSSYTEKRLPKWNSDCLRPPKKLHNSGNKF
jgi:hypothetical protein